MRRWHGATRTTTDAENEADGLRKVALAMGKAGMLVAAMSKDDDDLPKSTDALRKNALQFGQGISTISGERRILTRESRLLTCHSAQRFRGFANLSLWLR